MKEKNTQEIYDNICEVSKKDALKYIVVTKCVHEFRTDTCSMENNPLLKGLNNVLLCNRLMIHMKLLRHIFFIPKKMVSYLGTKKLYSEKTMERNNIFNDLLELINRTITTFWNMYVLNMK